MNKSIGVSWLRRDEIDFGSDVVIKKKQSWLSPIASSQTVVSITRSATQSLHRFRTRANAMSEKAKCFLLVLVLCTRNNEVSKLMNARSFGVIEGLCLGALKLLSRNLISNRRSRQTDSGALNLRTFEHWHSRLRRETSLRQWLFLSSSKSTYLVEGLCFMGLQHRIIVKTWVVSYSQKLQVLFRSMTSWSNASE